VNLREEKWDGRSFDGGYLIGYGRVVVEASKEVSMAMG
jgi:hypothetical protein